MSLCSLPNEILIEIIEGMQCQLDINAIACTSRRFYSLANDHLYRTNVSHNDHRSALIWAAKRDLENTARYALEAGANTTLQAKNHENPLTTAAKFGSAKVVAILLAFGSDVNEIAGGFPPLFYALAEERLAAFEALLRGGADTERLTRVTDGLPRCTALHIACLCGPSDFVRVLLRHGANVNSVDAENQTPLHWALSYKLTKTFSILFDREVGVVDRARMIRVLRLYGANPCARSKHRETPRGMSRHFERGVFSHILGTSPAHFRDKLFVQTQWLRRGWAAVRERFHRRRGEWVFW